MATTMNSTAQPGSENRGHNWGRYNGIIYFIVALAIVIGAALLFMRGRGTTEPTTPDSTSMSGARNDQGQGGENMNPANTNAESNPSRNGNTVDPNR